MKLLVAIAALLLTGCATPIPERGDGEDYAAIVSERRDSVWRSTGLPDALRPEVDAHAPAGQFFAAKAFAGCMAQLGWPSYSVGDNSYGYQDISLVDSDPERLDWYECYAAYPVDSAYTLRSVEEFDFVYDYFQDSLIPCLAENGHPVTAAPSRLEFRTTWKQWSDPLFPFLWNPYYELKKHGAVDTSDVEKLCPPEPPNQDFYEMR